MDKIDVSDRLTPGAKAVVKMRTADMIHAAQASRGTSYRDVSAFFAGAWHGREVADLIRDAAPVARRNFNDAWSGNPATDKAWAHDILTGGR